MDFLLELSGGEACVGICIILFLFVVVAYRVGVGSSALREIESASIAIKGISKQLERSE